jgi:hypothetical protein
MAAWQRVHVVHDVALGQPQALQNSASFDSGFPQFGQRSLRKPI